MRKNGAICSGFTQLLKGGRGSGIQGSISHWSSGLFPYWEKSFIVFSSFDVVSFFFYIQWSTVQRCDL